MTACVTLWIGPRLGAVERACMKSVLRQGHPLTLYCYDLPEGVPPGVAIEDAAAIIPRERIVCHRNGSVALFADWFRYELQRRGCGTWVDADVYLLAPLPPEPPYLFGREGRFINQAVLRLPADCPVIAEAIALFEEEAIPSWLGPRDRLAARWRLLKSGRAGIEDMPWGTTGPHAFTALLVRHGLADQALPKATFYPAGWEKADWIRDPGVALDDMAGEGTIAVHLWNQLIKGYKDQPAPVGSFLARLQREGQLAET
jgi:hypothetical protein